jgi:translation initiation factor IF-2
LDKLTGEKFGSAYLRSVGFLKGAYFCSRAGLGKINGGGAAAVTGGPADGCEGMPDCPGVTGGNGDAEPAGTKDGGGGNGGRILPGAKGGAPGGGMPGGGMKPGGGKGKPGGGLYNEVSKESHSKKILTYPGGKPGMPGNGGNGGKAPAGGGPPGKN